MMDDSISPGERMRTFLKLETAPDVLDTIANLSNDEVFTAPGLANKMLDLLPEEVWSNPDLKFLDPCCKTGVFLREITKRLMVGLVKIIPDVDARREHILRQQVYGIAITELTALMSRRTLYCASDAMRMPNPDFPENCFSAVVFDTPEGNIKFPEVDHDYDNKGKCRVCGASEGAMTGTDREGRESYAYPFIHMDIQEIFGDMQFDVVIGNPPYQMNDGGGKGSSASPIYQHFIEKSLEIAPRYISMIIPSRWFSGGKGLDGFRSRMSCDRRISNLVDFENSSEIFPGVDVAGGICYFLWDREHDGLCAFQNGKTKVSSNRNLDEFDVVVRDAVASEIINKINLLAPTGRMDKVVSVRRPFGVSSTCKPSEPGLPCWFTQKIGKAFVSPLEASDKAKIRDSWKVLIPFAPIAGQTDFSKPLKFYSESNVRIAKPGEICSETYLVAASFKTEIEAANFKSYIFTKLFRFLLLQRVASQNVTRGCFAFIPDLIDYGSPITDESLIESWGITEKEWEYISTKIV